MDSPAVQSDSTQRKGGGNAALIVGVVVLAVVALGLGAYIVIKAGGLEKTTPIGDIKANLREYDEHAVTIQGTASAPLNVLGLKAYRLTDDSGEIMVVTEKGLPSDGEADVRVDGYVKQMFQVAGMQQTIVYEPAEGVSADKADFKTPGEKIRDKMKERATTR